MAHIRNTNPSTGENVSIVQKSSENPKMFKTPSVAKIKQSQNVSIPQNQVR